jgi:hypothetical protein
MGMIFSQLDQESLGSIAFTIVFLLSILFDDRFGSQRNDLSSVGMNDGCTKQMMRVGDFSGTLIDPLLTGLTMNILRREIAGAIQ